MQTRAADLASVTDQSGSHADASGPGSAATSVIAHIGVIVWQVDDAPTYDLAVFRSLHAGLRHWIEITAASNRAFDDRIVLPADALLLQPARHRRARVG